MDEILILAEFLKHEGKESTEYPQINGLKELSAYFCLLQMSWIMLGGNTQT